MDISKNRLVVALVAFVGLGMTQQAVQATIFSVSDVQAYYQFEDSGYSTVSDSSGNGNHGAIGDGSGGGSFAAGGISGNGWISGDNGQAAWGNASDNVNVPGEGVKLVGAASFAATAWFKISSLDLVNKTGTGNNHFFDTDRGGGQPGWRVSMIAGQNDQAPNLTFSSVGGTASITDFTWDEDVWYFVAASSDFDGAGSSVIWLAREDSDWASRQGAVGSVGSPTGGAELSLGRIGAAGSFNGVRDEHAIFNRGITGAEAQAIFEAGLAGNGLSTLIPEPGTAILLALGATLLGVIRKRR